MVVSNRNVSSGDSNTIVLDRARSWSFRLERLFRQWTALVVDWIRPARGTADGSPMVPYITMPLHRSDMLLERSTLLFRRENQGESFDDDVSALRDQVGGSRRDDTSAEQLPEEDQTTYTPPRATWTGSSSPAESTSYEPIPQPASRIPEDAGDASVIAQDTRWDGTVQSSGALHVYGSLSGQVNADGDVYVAEGASVSADVRAGNVTVAGSLEGSVECSGRFEVLPSGHVQGDVVAPRLVVHEGAIVAGKLRMTSSGIETAE